MTNSVILMFVKITKIVILILACLKNWGTSAELTKLIFSQKQEGRKHSFAKLRNFWGLLLNPWGYLVPCKVHITVDNIADDDCCHNHKYCYRWVEDDDCCQSDEEEEK